MSKTFTAEEWVKRAMYCADWPGGTAYDNHYPYNCLYLGYDNVLWADCVNLQKSLLNGYDVYNMKKGANNTNFSKTGDCDEWGLLSQCSDVTQNFKKLDDKPRILYMGGHIGMYLGKEIVKNKKTYNCVECTAAWGEGILYSYVTDSGARFNHKNGSQNGYWTHSGLADKWVEYKEKEVEVVDLKGAWSMKNINRNFVVPSDYSKNTKVGAFKLEKGKYMLSIFAHFEEDATGTRYIELAADTKELSMAYRANCQAVKNGPTRLDMVRPIYVEKPTTFTIYASHNGSKPLKVTTYAGFMKQKVL